MQCGCSRRHSMSAIRPRLALYLQRTCDEHLHGPLHSTAMQLSSPALPSDPEKEE